VPPSTSLNPERVSPELALVDPQLADVARSVLPHEDTLGRIELLVRAHRIADSRAAGSSVQQARPPAAVSARRRSRHRRSAVAAGAAAATAVACALLVGVRIDLNGQPADANTSTGAPPVATTKPPLVERATPRQVRPRAKHVDRARGSNTQRPAPSVSSRRFVWAPAPGATGYHVEFFRGSGLVFEADTA
jgi:hypothetical protein